MSSRTRATIEDLYRVPDQGELAEAEPAVPGWRMPVDVLFEQGGR